jgi:hypothetical protein
VCVWSSEDDPIVNDKNIPGRNHTVNTLPTFQRGDRVSDFDAQDVLNIDEVEGVVADPVLDQRSAIEAQIQDMLHRAHINGAVEHLWFQIPRYIASGVEGRPSG